MYTHAVYICVYLGTAQRHSSDNGEVKLQHEHPKRLLGKDFTLNLLLRAVHQKEG